jgi:hypothetical protein
MVSIRPHALQAFCVVDFGARFGFYYYGAAGAETD